LIWIMSLSALDAGLLVRQTFVARVEHHATLGSTNDRANQHAAEGTGPLPLLIVADEQTAGRGRGAHRWWTAPGSLACSLLLDVDELGVDCTRLPLVALATGVAIVETVAPLVPAHTVGLHWPNDVSVAGRKLAGILVEVPCRRRLVLGIGLNMNSSLRQAPPELQKTATTLLELTGTRHDRMQILLAMLDHLAGRLGQLALAPEQIAARADALCLQHGQMLRIQLGRESVEGRCAGIASDGALLLDTAEGRRRFYSGELR
jgi:BirA family biotin operon repressor/biotin-[acetyl-CoA-carboxylase] ligase